MRVSLGDVELHVHEKGEGRPIVALHGGPGLDGSLWFPALDPLVADGWRVLAPDQRANGRSDAGEVDSWTVPQMADDLEELIRRLELVRPVVMGWSFGSFVAQSHMARHASAAAYVLMGTVAGPDSLRAVHDRLAVFEPEHLRVQVTSSWQRESTVQTPEECKQLMDDQWPFHVADPEGPLVRWLIENDRVVYRPEVLRHFATGGEYGLSDLRGTLTSFSRPLLVLSGALDRTTPAAAAQELVDAIPVAEHVVFDGAAHVVPYEQPEAFRAALRTFLARV